MPERALEIDGAERLGDADDQPSQHDADEVGHAAEHDHEQRDDGITQALGGLDRRARQQQCRSQRQNPDTSAKVSTWMRPTSIPISAAACAF